MRTATPFVLTLFLAVLAFVLFLGSKQEKPQPEPAPATTEGEALPEENAEATAEEEEPEDESEAATSSFDESLWPMAKSDIPADPKAVFGNLPNGFRYMILPNEEPPNRFSVRLHIAAGSLMEAEDQRGLAHFLEHMVFNGTETYKDANDLINEMRSRGIAFGAHVNAYTSFNETVYMLNLPDMKPDTMDLSFQIMRDFGDGALLTEEEIDAERGVILSEKASRDSVSYRMMEQQFIAMLPNSLITKRFPIGTEEVIQNATRERFLDFYTRYYIPERMTFIVVGDVDPEEMKSRIEATFSSLKNPVNPGKDPELGLVSVPEGVEPHVFSDPELDSTDISLNLIRSYEEKPDTVANRKAEYPVQIAHSILGRRFERIAKQEDSPIAAGSAIKYSMFNAIELGAINIVVADDRWEEAVPILEQEFRRALEHGFTESELSEVKANIINAYQEAVKRKDSRKSENLASGIASSISDGDIFSTPEKDLEIAQAVLADITPEIVLKEFTNFWQAPGYHLVLSTKEAPENGAINLAAVYQESSSVELEAPAEREVAEFAYTDFGTPGTVVSTKEIEDFAITQLVLSNNVRVNLKQTDFEKNRIHMMARIGNGQLTQPMDKPMLDDFASAIFGGGGLKQHSNDELREILAGRNVSSGLSIDEGEFRLSGATTPEDQLLQLQLMVATLTEPGYREEALWQFQKSVPILLQNLKHTVTGPLKEMNSWMHGNDARYSLPSEEQLSSYTIDDVKQWLTPELTKGYLELNIIGDFDQESLIQDLLATFGTLSERAAKPATTGLNTRSVKFPEIPTAKTFTYESKIPQAVAIAIWKIPGYRNNIQQFRRFNLLADIYKDRLREEIREKLGASYSPGAGASGSETLDDHGYLLGQAMGKPEDIELLLNTMETIATDLSENGASQEELDRAIAPTVSMLEKTLRENSYWLGTVMARSQETDERLDLARNRMEDYQTITLEEINALAKEYFSPEKLLRISILPAE